MEKIDLRHQAIIQQAFSTLTIGLSEYSFANLYLFREAHDYSVCQNGGGLFIRGKTYDGHRFLMPTVRESLQSKSSLELLEKEADFFFPIPEDWLSTIHPDLFSSSYRDSDSDYVYEVNSMGHYPGRHLSKKRNLVKQFLELHEEVHSSPLDSSQKEAARRVLKEWQSHMPAESDYQACEEAITLLETLRLEGQIYFVGQVPVGFVIGEAINPEMFVLHFAKADIHYKGVYQYMHQEFAQRLEGRYQFINMEQDLGLEELRHSKHSYQPFKVCKKFRLKIAANKI